MNIFIGTSSAYVEEDENGMYKLPPGSTLTQIINALKKHKYNVMPWWKDDIILIGAHFLDSLISAARNCDFGIFIFGPDDPLEEDGKSVTRDNVVLECGMFLALNDIKNTCIIVDKEGTKKIKRSKRKVKIPSDLAGIKYASYHDAKIVEKVVKYFTTKEAKPEPLRTFYFNDEIIKKIVDKEFTKWGTKALYIGSESAKKWAAIENHKDYTDEYQKEVLADFLKIITDKVNTQEENRIDFEQIGNIISFGPGCGTMDNIIFKTSYNINPYITYIPIDLNPYLALNAIELVRSHRAKLNAPFAIIDDFENDYEYTGKIIREKVDKIGQSNLFIMLGGTFCNLSGNESSIFQQFDHWMKSGDYLLLDAFIINDNYDFNDDHGRKIETMPDQYKDLLINSLMMKYSYHFVNQNTVLTSFKKLPEELKNIFNNLIVMDPDQGTQIESDIADTHIAKYIFVENPEYEILTAKRYKFDNLYKFITAKPMFEMVNSRNGFQDSFGNEVEIYTNKSRGLFLFKKK